MKFRISGFLAFCAATALSLPAQTLTTLYNFDNYLVDGLEPEVVLVQGTDGNFYGTTQAGGVTGAGTAFRMTPTGTLTTIYNFCSLAGCADGGYASGLTLDPSGDFYGTAGSGGSAGRGTIFRLTPTGSLTTLYNFCASSLCNELPSSLVLAADGFFYGTAQADGESGGTIFRITPSGEFTPLYTFCLPPCAQPESLSLVQAFDGDFYGASDFASKEGGTIFKVTPSGLFTTVVTFPSDNSTYPFGRNPTGGLLQASNGDFYGSAIYGGAENEGTTFQMTPKGTLKTLNSLSVNSPMIQATDGNLYGTYEAGEIFLISASTGTYTDLYNFCSLSNCDDGSQPLAGMVQGTDGDFYGTTYHGGLGDSGTIFKFSMGLGPFVKALPSSGQVGQGIQILGTDLTGATSVTFEGIAARFKVVSSSLIQAEVPAGAATGKIEVITPGGPLLSNIAFAVLPH